MSELTTSLRKRANCVYIAVEESIARDISESLKAAADRIEELEKLFENHTCEVSDWVVGLNESLGLPLDSPAKDIAPAVAELKDQHGRYFDALAEIINPVGAMLNRVPPGHVFDGDMAHRICKQPEHAVQIARKALALENRDIKEDFPAIKEAH